jgi:flavin-dependent dehydrogenase
MQSWDVIIVGGGPAGATVASILLRHRPEARVLVIERDRFPRFHVGETLVAEINRILVEMGVYDAVDNAGFVRKYGATFRWGSQEATWDLTFGELEPIRPAEEKLGPVQTRYTWHVDRAVYDDLLMGNAERLGATRLEGRNVVDTLRDADGRVTGVRLEDGALHGARWVVDATGQAGFLGSTRDRAMDPHLRNVAYWGYFEGADLVPELCGGREHSRAFICAHGLGWTWLFPIDETRVSVGVVTTAELHKTRTTTDAKEFFLEALGTSEELTHILRDARLVPYAEGMAEVLKIADFSYVSDSIVQPGLLKTGDAAGFVDPILSVGCFLAQVSARHLAYSLATLLDPDSKLTEDVVLSSYQAQTRDTVLAFRELTYFFYRFNERPDAWWKEARRLVEHAGLPKRATDKHAFAVFASGFAARRSVFREPTQVFDEPFFHDAFRRLVDPGADARVEEVHLSGPDVVALRGAPTLSDAVVPLDGRGKVVPALRVEFHPSDAFEGDRLIRRLLVPPSMRALFGLVDGRASCEQLGDQLAASLGVEARFRKDVRRYVRQVLGGLVERGLADVVYKHEDRPVERARAELGA